MTLRYPSPNSEPDRFAHRADRRRLFGWSMLGLGAFLGLVSITLGGLYVIYLLAAGEIFAPLYCQLKLSAWCPRPGWAIGIMIVAGILFAIWLIMIVRVLLMGGEPLDGIPVNAHDAPELFALIEQAAGGRRAARLDAVVIDADCNAGVHIRPTLGILGPMRTRLLIGLPLLDAVDKRELPALLSHEMEHLAEHYGVLETTAQRADVIWRRVGVCCTEGWLPGGGLLVKFASWYLDKLDAVGLRLSRHNEFEADAAAAVGAGANVSAQAILRTVVASLWFEKMWELFPRRLRRHAEPRFKPFHVTPRWFRKLDDAERFERLLRIALVQGTSRRDTHPGSEERIAALGPDPRVPPPVRTPASRILGTLETRLRADMDAMWREQVAEFWGAGHENAKREEEQLVELEREAAGGQLRPEEAKLMAHLTRELRVAARAAPLYRAFIERHPGDAEMHYSLGEALLDMDDEEGLVHLDKARALDPGLSPGVIALASEYLAFNDEMGRARSYSAEIDTALDELDLAGEERSGIEPSDVLDPHGLDRAAVAMITERAAGIRGVRRVWLARKRVERLQARPCLVLVAEYSMLRSVLGTADSEHDKLLEACADLSFDMFCFRHAMATRPFLAKIKAVPGSNVFDREASAAPAVGETV